MTPATSGPTYSAPFASYDPDSSCWKTSLDTSLWALTLSSVTWPKRGSMRNGSCYQRPESELPTDAPDCSSLPLLPTVRATRGGSHTETVELLPTPSAGNFNDGETPESWEARRERQKARGINGNGMGTPLTVAVQLLPTPLASDGEKGGPNWRGGAGDLRLSSAVAGIAGGPSGPDPTATTAAAPFDTKLLPTPTTSDTNRPGAHGDGGADPRTAVSLLPTPQARDWKDAGPSEAGRRRHSPPIVDLLPTPTSQAAKHGADDRGLGTLDDFNLWSVATRIGAPTPPPSTDGKPPSDDPPPDLLSLLHEEDGTDSAPPSSSG